MTGGHSGFSSTNPAQGRQSKTSPLGSAAQLVIVGDPRPRRGPEALIGAVVRGEISTPIGRRALGYAALVLTPSLGYRNHHGHRRLAGIVSPSHRPRPRGARLVAKAVLNLALCLSALVWPADEDWLPLGDVHCNSAADCLRDQVCRKVPTLSPHVRYCVFRVAAPKVGVLRLSLNWGYVIWETRLRGRFLGRLVEIEEPKLAGVVQEWGTFGRCKPSGPACCNQAEYLIGIEGLWGIPLYASGPLRCRGNECGPTDCAWLHGRKELIVRPRLPRNPALDRTFGYLDIVYYRSASPKGEQSWRQWRESDPRPWKAPP